MLAFDTRCGRIGLLTDFMHVRVSEADRAQTPIGRARHGSLRTDVSLGAPLNVGGRDTESWADPVLGAKGLYHLGPRCYAMGWAMAGGDRQMPEELWQRVSA